MSGKRCPNCKSSVVICPECGKKYAHGLQARCIRESCVAVNAPLDCAGCGLVVSDDLSGVIDFEMNLIAYGEKVRQ